MNSVTKTSAEIYRVRADHEYATIVVQGWQSHSTGAAPRIIEQGEILIHSSHGSWGYQWTNLGRSIKQFLVVASFDSMMGKLLPGELREFDFEASLASWKRHLVAARRSRQIDADLFREIWDESCDSNECGIELFMHRLALAQPLELRGHELWESLNAYAVCRYSPAAKNFWNELWPLFVEKLQSESAAANDRHMEAA